MLCEYTNVGLIIRVGLLVIIGIPVVWYSSRAIRRVLTQQMHAHAAQIMSNIVWYFGLTFIVITLLHDVGLQLSPLLGAAGLIGIAVGFAARTTMANVISGIFLLMERSFSVNDKIVYNGITGYIESIDLLSIKLRMGDGALVRIPNEALINNVMKNITYFPYTRLTFKISVHSVHDIDIVFQMIHKVIDSSDLHLKDQKNIVLLDGRSIQITSSLHEIMYMNDILVHVWVKHEDSGQVTADFITHISKKLVKEGLEGTIRRLVE